METQEREYNSFKRKRKTKASSSLRSINLKQSLDNRKIIDGLKYPYYNRMSNFYIDRKDRQFTLFVATLHLRLREETALRVLNTYIRLNVIKRDKVGLYSFTELAPTTLKGVVK